MTNIELMEKALPTAPLKIAALESCKDLAEKVDQYIVSFRKNSLHDFLDPAIYSSSSSWPAPSGKYARTLSSISPIPIRSDAEIGTGSPIPRL